MTATEALAGRVLAALIETAHAEGMDLETGAARVSIEVSPDLLENLHAFGAGLEDLEEAGRCVHRHQAAAIPGG